MPVDSPSDDYELMLPRWRRCRDCMAGEAAIKAAGTTYLPALAGHNPSDRSDDYWSYNDRALFYNCFGRAVDGLVGMVFRRPPIIINPSEADDLLDNIDMDGRSIVDLAQVLLTEGLVVGRRGLLVDHTTGQFGDVARPYMALYSAEQILDVVYTTDLEGRRTLKRVRLLEVVEVEDPDDEFANEIQKRIRVLDLDEAGEYRQRVFVQVEASEDMPGGFEEVEELSAKPLVQGVPLRYVPFWPIGTGVSLVFGEIEQPPLLDLANVNISHFRTMADIENAAHMAGVPTAIFTGTELDLEVKLGSTKGIVMPEPEAKAFYLSYGGDGLAALEQRAAVKEQQMAYLGARMMQPEKRQVEAAETAQIHRQGEISILATMANHQSRQMTGALRLFLEWAGLEFEDAIVKLNDDLSPIKVPAQMLGELRNTWLSGGISFETFWLQMQEGEVAPVAITAEQELEKIRKEKIDAAEFAGLQQQVAIEASPDVPPDQQGPAPQAPGTRPPGQGRPRQVPEAA